MAYQRNPGVNGGSRVIGAGPDISGSNVAGSSESGYGDNIQNPYSYDQELLDLYFSGYPTSSNWLTGRGEREFRNKILRNYEQYQLWLQFENELQAAIADADYNSYVETVNRARQAGVNLDLQGASEGDASNQIGSATAPGSDTLPSEAVPGLGDILGSISSVFSTAMGIATGVQSYRLAQADLNLKKQQLLNLGVTAENLGLQNLGLRLDNFGKHIDSFAHYVLNSVPQSDLESFYNNTLGDDGAPVGLSVDPDMYAAFSGLTKEQAQAVTSNMNQRLSSPAFRKAFTEYLKSGAQNKFDFDSVTSDPRYSPEWMMNKAMVDYKELTVGFNEIVIDYQEFLMSENRKYVDALDETAKAAAENSENYYTRLFNGAANPVTDASAQNAENKYKEINARMTSFLYERAKSLMDNQSTYKEGLDLYRFVAHGQFLTPKESVMRFLSGFDSGFRRSQVDAGVEGFDFYEPLW